VKARNISATHEHEWEAAPGLPSTLPQGERIVWQGSPDWQQLAIHAFHVRKIAIYFALMVGIQLTHLWGEGLEGRELMVPIVVSASLAMLALALLTTCAWFAGKSSLYTFTNKRVVMRIGIVLTLTFNLPYRRIAGASSKDCQEGCQDIALELYPEDRIGWAHLWPHQKAWHVKQPQPTLRCVPNGEAVSALLYSMWREHHQEEKVVTGVSSVKPANDKHSQHPQGVMA
jgi:hypothetical protein